MNFFSFFSRSNYCGQLSLPETFFAYCRTDIYYYPFTVKHIHIVIHLTYGCYCFNNIHITFHFLQTGAVLYMCCVAVWFFFFFCLTIWRYFYMSIHKYQSSFSWVHMGKTYLFAQSSDNGHIGCLLFCYGKQCDNEHTTIFMFEPMCRLNYEM